jgi:hypothetical protein
MTALDDALTLIDARKIAVGGDQGWISEDPTHDLALVASGFDVDMTELMVVAFQAAKQIAELGIESGMHPGESMVSAWLDGFMVALAYGKVREKECES